MNYLNYLFNQRPHSSSNPGLLGTGGHSNNSSHLTSPMKRSAHHPALHHHSPGVRPPGAASAAGLYDGIDLYSSKLGIPLPNPAPEIDLLPPPQMPSAPANPPPVPQGHMMDQIPEDPDEPKKKKYAKEAWPGRKPTGSLLV